MARYRVTTYKHFFDHDGFKPWSNVFHVETSSLENALAGGLALANIERYILKEYVKVFRVHAVLDAPLHLAGASQEVDVVGLVTGDFNLMLPLWNVFRITLSDGAGRPSQMYIRPPLQEDEMLAGNLITAVVDDMQTNFCDRLSIFPGLCSNSGDTFTSIIAQPNVQMRQTNWHRRVRPGFKRGWVPA